MSMAFTSDKSDIEKIEERIHALEMRIESFEALLKTEKAHAAGLHQSPGAAFTEQGSESEFLEVDEAAIESRIGEYGLAWLGSLVLLFGIIFLMAFASNQGFPVLASALGYASAAGVFILAHFLRKSFPHMVFMLNISSHILIYYITLRLFFFSASPIIPYKGLDLALLMAAIGVQFYLAKRQLSELLTGIALVLIIVTAMIADSFHITMSLITVAAAVSLYFLYRYNWWRLVIVSLILVYVAQVMWLFNNPLLGHPVSLAPSVYFTPVYLFACGAIYSVSILIFRNGEVTKKGLNTTVVLNGLFFAITIFLATLIYYRTNYITMFSIIAAFCLLFSVLLHLRIRNLFAPAVYACFGFMAMSVAVYGYAKFPDAYFYLALQSFLVVSMALWFRSKIIVVVNSGLYLGILMIYLASSPPVDRISFCFAFVAFATARILNWRKERLTLKTDLMRNMYLVALFFTMLYAFYHAVPERYITLSWTAVAAGYFLLSLQLKNIKYRWMAIGTLLVTVVYLFLVDLAHLSVGYRVVASLFLAGISISASLYYTLKIRKKRNLKKDGNLVAE